MSSGKTVLPEDGFPEGRFYVTESILRSRLPVTLDFGESVLREDANF